MAMPMMMMQNGVSSSKIMVLVGAGLTGSVILRNGQLFEVIAQIQELMKGVKKVEVGSYDTDVLAAQVRRLTQEIRELTLSSPVTIVNGNSGISGNLSSYLMPAATIGALGYCYMWWKGLSLSDVMFVTKQNMANAVANVSKQLEHVSAVLASTKRHLTERLEIVDGKLDEEMESTKLIMNEVVQVRSDISEIGFDVEVIQKMIFGLEGKLELLEDKQDFANLGIAHLCQFARSFQDGKNPNPVQDVTAKHLPISSAMDFENKSLKGLQFLVEASVSEKEDKLEIDRAFLEGPSEGAAKGRVKAKTIIHKSWSRPVGIPMMAGKHGLAVD